MVRENRNRDCGPDPTFEQVFEHYYRPVYYYFAKRGFSVEECHDMAQETFLRAYKGWESYRPGGEGEGGWIFTIAANLYRNTLRQRRAHKRDVQKSSLCELEETGVEPIELRDDPEERAVLRQRQRLVMERIESLPPRMRQCFLLRYIQGRRYKEIAEVMQTSIQSVRSQLHLATRRLSAMVGREGGDGMAKVTSIRSGKGRR